jgi:hypothetical protein
MQLGGIRPHYLQESLSLSTLRAKDVIDTDGQTKVNMTHPDKSRTHAGELAGSSDKLTNPRQRHEEGPNRPDPQSRSGAWFLAPSELLRLANFLQRSSDRIPCSGIESVASANEFQLASPAMASLAFA